MTSAPVETAVTDWLSLHALLSTTDADQVRRALAAPHPGPRELALLLSEAADPLLEELAQRAHRITLARFGRTVQLYAPLYVSNHCIGGCRYCGFRVDRSAKRRSLTIDEIRREGELLAAMGIRHVLLVAGEDPKRVTPAFLAEATAVLKEKIPSISIEVAPLGEPEYEVLAHAGVDGVTLYQEAYDPSTYATCHPNGPKADYGFRLGALDRAGKAGIHKLNVGALLGLAPWRSEVLHLGLHAHELEAKHWRSQVSVGLPRLKKVPADFHIPCPVDDRSLAHIIAVLRIFLPNAGLVLSTREPADLRRHLLPLGITQMSAGSKTEPGGYSNPGAATDQFEISDSRTAREVADQLLALGYDPVWKDWEPSFGATLQS